jgi:DNA-directed RNA polymerase specialized sigma24 family protein
MTHVAAEYQSADAYKTESGPGERAVRRVLLADRRNVLHYLVRELGDIEEAREVWQCFALRALDRSSALREPKAVRVWMSRVLATTIADHRRGLLRTRRHEVAIDEIDANDGVFISEAASPEDEAPCECIHHVLRSLRPDYAEIVSRADLLSQPREEIAVSLKTTVNNIGVRLHRGRAALRRGLEHACGGCIDQTVFQCGCPEMQAA